MTLRRIIAILALSAALPVGPAVAAAEPSEGEPVKQPTFKLEGRAEVQQFNHDMQAWQGSQLYRQGAYFMGINDFSAAGECFRQSGNAFETAVGPSKMLAEARYAEAQCRRLLKQKAQAVHLFQIAIDLFTEYDPRNPFLKAGKGYLDDLNGKNDRPLQAKATKTMLTGKVEEQKVELHQLLPKNDFIDEQVALKGNATHLEGGVLKDEANFAPGKFYQDPMSAELSDNFVHDHLYKAFLKMTCLEMAELGGNYYTAPNSYKPFVANGKPIISGASDDSYSPVVDMKLNGREYGVPIKLPEMAKGTKNVLLATDGLHVIAIDPRTTDTWRLRPNFDKSKAEFNWHKLNHKKDPPKPSYALKSRRVSSPFAR
jgi:hypothetical protein